MKIQRTKQYVAFTGSVYDTEEEAETAEADFLDSSGVEESLKQFQDVEGFSMNGMVTPRKAMIFHALRMQRIADEAKAGE